MSIWRATCHPYLLTLCCLRADLENEVQECKCRLSELLEKERLLQQYQASLSKTQAEIFALADKIDIISDIWRSVSPSQSWVMRRVLADASSSSRSTCRSSTQS